MASEKYNAAINALTARAKIMGYFIDRKEVMHLRENISDEQLRLKIVKAAKQLNITEEEIKSIE